MTTWNSRQLPYPLLSPWTDDYGDKTFSAVVPHAVLNNGRTISLTIKYHLTSQSLLDLVSTGKAYYVALLSCSKTSMRFAYSSTHDEDVEVLNAGDYSQSIRLRPYLVTTQSIDGFISDGGRLQSSDISDAEGFDPAFAKPIYWEYFRSGSLLRQTRCRAS